MVIITDYDPPPPGPEVTCLVIWPDHLAHPPETRTFARDTLLATLHEILGGYLEAVPCFVPDTLGGTTLAYVNEEGMRLNLPVNELATQVTGIQGNVILGPMVVFGPIDGPGYETSVDERLAAFLTGPFGPPHQ